MHICPKCFKQSPEDAAFCGFCGAALQRPAEDAAKRTVFGYVAGGEQDQDLAPADQLTQPVSAPPTMPVEPVFPMSPGQSTVAGRYLLKDAGKKLPVGVLWRAQDEESGGQVDLLLVDGAVFPSPLDQERARRELRQLQKVDCPSVQKILDHGKHDGQLFVVTAPSDGQTLDEVVAGGPVGLEEAQRLIREIGTALAEAQKVGVIHRDVAPHNVLVTEAGEVKVRGFGLAAPLKRHVFGTPEYLSPEQATGRPVDQRSNIYSLGALMYHLLVGTPPFTGSAAAVLESHQKADPPAIPSDRGYPARVKQLVRKALDKSSSRRHLTLRQFLREVESLVAATNVPEAPPPPPVSFETPLHGVTALTGGQRPPSSEMPRVPLPIEPDRKSDEMAEAATLAPDVDRVALPTSPPQPPPPAPVVAPARIFVPASALEPEPAGEIPTAKTLLQEGGQRAETAAGADQRPLTRPPVTPDSGALVGGEVSGGERVSLHQSSEHKPVEPSSPRTAPGAPPPQQGKAGFRETMWFFKGEMESALAEEGSGEPPPPETDNIEDLREKYKDDGSLSDEAAARLSLRTGKTQAMQAMSVPKGKLPGKAMDAKDFLDEMHRGRRVAIWIGITIVVAGAVALAIWLIPKFTGQ